MNLFVLFPVEGGSIDSAFFWCVSPSSHHVFQGASVRRLYKGRTQQSRRRRGRSNQPRRGLFGLLSEWGTPGRQRQTLLPAALHASSALPLQRRRRWGGGRELRWKWSGPLQVRAEHAAQAVVSGVWGCGVGLPLRRSIVWSLQSIL